MKITRRNFLAAAPLAAGAILQFSGLAAGQSSRKGLFAIPDGPGSDALARLNWDSFYQYVHTDFTFGQGGNAVRMTLTGMADTKPEGFTAKSRGQECFVMKFQGPSNQPLKQGTYKVNHFALGDFDLFITDGGRVKRNQYYIAVINRIVS